MSRVPSAHLAALAAAFFLCAAPAAARPLVDCSKSEFKRPDSARSLYLWSRGAEEKIIKAKKQGVFGVDPRKARGDAVSRDYCPVMISYRGTAHCKEPANAEYRAALARLIKVCEEASKPPKATKGLLVDCRDKRFTHREATVKLLLRWTEMSLSSIDGLPEREHSRLPVLCEQALKHAGTAHCKAPDNPEPRAAIAKVRKKCAAAKATRAAKEAQAAKAAQDRKAAIKANRKIVPFPRRTYRGGGAGALAGAMRRALLASRLAKSASEILKVQPMGRWKSGRYTDTKVPYKKITGIVLWWDKDKDGVCRFVSYNFNKERRGGRWSPLKAKSFCMGCPEGWTKCR
jgi:hypothetical protein